MRESKIESCSRELAAKDGWWGFKVLPFLVVGLPDCCYIGHGRVVFIEYKTAKGVLSAKQVRMAKKFAEYGVTIHVARSSAETMGILNAYKR